MTTALESLSPLLSPLPLIRAGEHAAAMTINRAWRGGRFVRVVPGVYVDADAWRTSPPWEQYVAKVRAVAATRPDAIFSHRAAAALRGVVIGGPSQLVHIIDMTGTSRRNGHVRIHTSRDHRDLVSLDGITATSVADTVVDIARTTPSAEGLAFADALLRTTTGLTSDGLQAVNETRSSSRNRDHARWALSRATGKPESVLESLSLAAIEWSGLAIPEVQTRFRTEGKEDRADFFWPSVPLIGEADGLAKYSGAFRDAPEAIAAEKDRESRLRRNIGPVVRWGWDDVSTPHRLGRLLRAAGVPVAGQPQEARLRTLISLGRERRL